ncbi:MAG: RNA polymerase sigma factor, partial [Thermomicrobiales bacterium]
MTTEELVVAAMADDIDAFSQLVTRYQAMAFTYALATIRDYHLAQDATQQALVVAYCSLGSLREPSRFGGWLRGIVRFECLRMLREHARRRVESLDAGERFDPADPNVDLEWQAEVSLEVRHVLDLMARLPERQRVVAQLYYLGDQPQAAVAEFLGISVSAVNNRLREARAHLRHEGVQMMSTTSMHTPDFAEIIGTV